MDIVFLTAIILAFLSLAFFVNAIPAMVKVKQTEPKLIWNSWILQIAGVGWFCSILFLIILSATYINLKSRIKEPPVKYEVVPETFYRKVN